MQIKFHSMNERPKKSCNVVLCTEWFELNILPYSYKYYRFGLRDTDPAEDVEVRAANVEYYLGWVYADELVWQMVVEHEAE